tara:strand:+ start:1665 stop:2276 length:612 start_codon:yes stop_codon:yes gene_type:complete
MKSLSEIETTVKRATRAAGFSWGISEDVGKSIRILEIFGLPGLKSLNQYFKDRNIKKFENLSLISERNLPNILNFCPIILGLNFLDQVKIIDQIKKIHFKNIAYPIIFISFLSRASEIIGKKIYIKIDEIEFLLNYNVNIFSNFFKHDLLFVGNTIEVEFIDNHDNFSDTEWKELYKLSEKTFVEETESLKQVGAGAGLTDND